MAASRPFLKSNSESNPTTSQTSTSDLALIECLQLIPDLLEELNVMRDSAEACNRAIQLAQRIINVLTALILRVQKYITEMPNTKNKEPTQYPCEVLEALTLNETDSAGASSKKIQPAVITRNIRKQGKASDSKVILPSNPIGYLQEFGQKYKGCYDVPKYYFSKTHNGVGRTCQCIFDGYKVYSAGSSGKQAKYNAAKKMIIALINDNYFEQYGAFTFKKSLGDTLFLGQPADPFTPQAYKNPISALYEYCQAGRRGRRRPEFSFTQNTNNLSASKEFECKCKLGSNTVYGKGANKLFAKTDAARNMCLRLGISFNGDNIFEREWSAGQKLNSEKNAVSALQEFCAALGLPLPLYGSKGVDKNFYIVVCNAGEVSAEGKHTIKKGAKELAAKKVLIKLQAQHQLETD